jgi:putative phosphoribosyl transferase
MVAVQRRVVILIDDGLATGSTMRAAVSALHQMGQTTSFAGADDRSETRPGASGVAEGGPARIIVAVPTAPPDACQELKAEVNEIVCAMTPEPFYGVGRGYEEFPQITDQEVRTLLQHAATDHAKWVEVQGTVA